MTDFRRRLQATLGSTYSLERELAKLIVEGLILTDALERFGELSEQRGERDRTLASYARFADLWRNAEPGRQPIVSDVRGRIARLQRNEARSACA